MVEIITLKEFQKFEKQVFDELQELKDLVSNRGLNRKWIKSSDIKVLLGVSHGKLQAMRDNREIPYSVIGGTIFYNIDEVNNALERRMITKDKRKVY